MPHLAVRAAATVAGTLLIAAGVPAAASAKTIGRASASGDYAIAVASGNAKHPRRVYVKVTSSPHQRAMVSWTMVCSRGYGAGSKSGQFTRRTTIRRKLKMPYRRPSNCTVSASAQLDNGGHVNVVLQAYR